MNISRIFLGLLLIVGAGGALAGGTSAFFSDTETSTGNSFTAGAIDLKVDNDSYYNGNKCAIDVSDVDGDDNTTEFVWQGNSGFPEPGTDCETSFPASDLDDGFVFFNFNDLKPDDEGEDTISLHVQNDAWACMDLTLTSNDDISSNEPELAAGDDPEDGSDAWDGELGSTLEFFWWADDGDNVYEDDELPISDGVQSLIDLAPQGGSFQVTLADSTGNVWGGADPLPANKTVYIAKAWCMGDLTLTPVAAGEGVNPQVATGVNCDGTSVGNEAQTDGVELTVVFEAVQARHNEDFRCSQNGQHATLTVNKIIIASSEGISVEDFQLKITGPDGIQVVGDNVPETGLTAGAYVVTETIVGDVGGATFTTTFGGACDASGNVTLNPGDNLVCTITNEEKQPVSLLSESFGTGSSIADIPNWEEQGNDNGADTQAQAAAATGNNTASPDGGRFALIEDNEWICRDVSTSGYNTLKLKYYWRGDPDAEDVESGFVEYRTDGNNCETATGWSNASHELDDTNNNADEGWSTLQSLNVPNGVTRIRFRNGANANDEDFRIDGVSLTGVPN